MKNSSLFAELYKFLGIDPDPNPRPPSQAPELGWSLDRRDPEAIRQWLPLGEWLHKYYFRVQTSGWEHVPEGPVLFVGSHNGGLAAPDMAMMMYDWYQRFGTERPVYGLMHRNVWLGMPGLAQMAEPFGAVIAHPKLAIAALRSQASVLVYPGGSYDVFRPHRWRDRIHLAGNRSFIKLALREKVPIVPLVSRGAHDTLVVLEDVYPLARWLHDRFGMPWLFGLDPEVFPVYLGLPWGIGVGPLPNLPLPVQITTRVGAPIWFERLGRAAAEDRDYVEACYERVEGLMQAELDRIS